MIGCVYVHACIHAQTQELQKISCAVTSDKKAGNGA